MTDQIVPRALNDIASELETETGKLKACIGLINQTLLFSYKDAEQVGRAQSQLFLLAEVIDDLHERLSALTEETYRSARMEKAAA